MSTTTGIPLAEAEIVGIVLESVFYGIFLAVFSFGMYMHRSNLSRPGARHTTLDRIVLIGSLLILLAVSVHWGLNFSILFEAVFKTTGSHSVEVYFAKVGAKSLAKAILFEVQIWIGDCILIYRLWRVYQKNYMIALVPAMIWISQVATGTVMLYGLSQSSAALLPHVKDLVTACFSLILINNLYCTALIAWRLWTTHKAVSRSGNTNLIRIMKVFVESAALFTVFMTLTFITFLASSNAEFLVTDMTPPAVGIAFCMIVAGLNSEADKGDRLSSFPPNQEHEHTLSCTSFTYPPGPKGECESFKLQPDGPRPDTPLSPMRPGVPAIVVGAAV